MNLLVIAVFLPALVGVVALASRHALRGAVAARAGVAVSIVSLVLLAAVWATRDAAAFAGEVDVRWIDAIGVRWHLGIDGISFPLTLMTAFLSALTCWSLIDDAPQEQTPDDPAEPSPDPEQSVVMLVVLVLVIQSAALGVFSALDLIVFFIFFELALVPMWFVINRWGDPHDREGRRVAATRFLLFTVLGSALMLVGFIAIALSAGSLQIPELAAQSPVLTGTVPLLGAVAIAVGLAVKAPVWPLHIWLPDAHSAAPTVGSVLLAGVFLKLGTYGLIRVLVAIAPEPSATLAPYLATFAVVGIIYASLACLRQSDLKRLIAYSSVGHMGFVVLGVATMSPVGIAAAVYASVAHGLITGMLFFHAGGLKRRYGSATFAVLGRGLYARAPWLAVSFAFAAIASLGLPGLAGFWGEMLSLRSAYEVGPVLDRGLAWTLLGVAAVGVVLTSAYVVVMLRRLVQGVPTPDDRDLDLTGEVRSEVGISVLLVASIVVLGLAPGLLVGVIEPSLPAVLGGGR